MKLCFSIVKMGYFSFYFEFTDKLGMVSGVLGHEKSIGNASKWLGSTVSPKKTLLCYGRNLTL